MADPKTCTVASCGTVIYPHTLTNGGNQYLFKQWAAAFAAGSTTKCLAHYLDTDVPTAYAAFFKGNRERHNRERD